MLSSAYAELSIKVLDEQTLDMELPCSEKFVITRLWDTGRPAGFSEIVQAYLLFIQTVSSKEGNDITFSLFV